MNDTDACAACHRAHTSFSAVGWKDGLGTEHASALLVGNAATMTEFCNACHGDMAPGASTNVASGIFDAGPSGGTGASVGAPAVPIAAGTFTDGSGVTPAYSDTPGAPPTLFAYQTTSTFGAPLNGGGFTRMPDPYVWQGETGTANTVTFVASSSSHHMDVNGPLWGSGSYVAETGGTTGMTCTDCHDPHGSSNYRLLKATVNGDTVGGYAADGTTPLPFVFSDEIGYPIPTSGIANPGGGIPTAGLPGGGWLKHQAGADQMAIYQPNYTDTNGTPVLHVPNQPLVDSPGTRAVSLSIWCSACHQDYNQSSASNVTSYDYKGFMPGNGSGPAAISGVYAAAGLGTKAYHRHAIDVTMAAGLGAGRALAEQVVGSPAWVPLENSPSGVQTSVDPTNGFIGCLTCHRAHGSAAEMSGWASAHLETAGSSTVYMPVRDNIAGVSPDKGAFGTLNNQSTSALLRADNRGVCERCHNK
ncbi:MAG: cytochrome c3 family protein [Actinomycetes bacterium]